MVYVLAVAAALCNALTSVFQRMGVEDAPEETTMRLSLMAHAIRRGVWLLGFGFMVLSFLFQSFALHIGRLSIVQPILTMELLFLVAILGTYFRFSISMREWAGASAIAFGLGGFLYFAAPGGGDEIPTNLGWIVVGGSTCFIIAVTVVATRWGPRWWKAAMFGSAAAIAYAFTAALIKTVSNYAATDWVTMLYHWQTYGVVVFGLLGLFLTRTRSTPGRSPRRSPRWCWSTRWSASAWASCSTATACGRRAGTGPWRRSRSSSCSWARCSCPTRRSSPG